MNSTRSRIFIGFEHFPDEDEARDDLAETAAFSDDSKRSRLCSNALRR